MINEEMSEPIRLAVEDVQDERAVFLPLERLRREEGEFGADGHPNLKGHRRFAQAYISLIAELTGWQ